MLRLAVLAISGWLILLIVPSAAGASEWWRPEGRISWDWQLTEPINLDRDVAMFDLDLFDTKAHVVARLKSRGVRTVCYLSAGSWEDWREDAALFPPEVIGDPYEGWPGESAGSISASTSSWRKVACPPSGPAGRGSRPAFRHD